VAGVERVGKGRAEIAIERHARALRRGGPRADEQTEHGEKKHTHDEVSAGEGGATSGLCRFWKAAQAPPTREGGAGARLFIVPPFCSTCLKSELRVLRLNP